MEKTALVTGANGFIGSHLTCKLVEKGFIVHALVRRETSNNPSFLKYVKQGKIIIHLGDITSFSFKKVPKVDYVFHIAGKVSVYGKMEEFEKTNCGGTTNILKYAKEKNPTCFVYFSSTAVYGYDGYTNLKETSEKKPFNNPYPITKLKTENIVQDFCTKNQIDFLIVRPGNVFGEYDFTSSHQIYTRIKKEKMPVCAKGKYKSCFVYVKNLVDATIFLTERKQYHNTDYNITDGQNETLSEMFTMIANTFKIRPKFLNVPKGLSKCVASVVEGFYKMFKIKKAPLITKFSIWQNCADYNFSIEKLLSTGFKPKYTMQEGVTRTCNWINKLEEKNGK